MLHSLARLAQYTGRALLHPYSVASFGVVFLLLVGSLGQAQSPTLTAFGGEPPRRALDFAGGTDWPASVAAAAVPVGMVMAPSGGAAWIAVVGAGAEAGVSGAAGASGVAALVARSSLAMEIYLVCSHGPLACGFAKSRATGRRKPLLR